MQGGGSDEVRGEEASSPDESSAGGPADTNSWPGAPQVHLPSRTNGSHEAITYGKRR